LQQGELHQLLSSDICQTQGVTQAGTVRHQTAYGSAGFCVVLEALGITWQVGITYFWYYLRRVCTPCIYNWVHRCGSGTGIWALLRHFFLQGVQVVGGMPLPPSRSIGGCFLQGQSMYLSDVS
jgi:hypothetical protein